MSIITRILVLTGGRAGQTVNLKGHQFVDGKIALHGSSPDVESLTHWMAVNWAAYPEGSEEAEAANGELNIQEDSKPDEKHALLSGDEPGGEGTPPGDSPDGGRSDGPDRGKTDGSIPEGNGHQDPRMDRIKEALNQLDAMDEAHWTTTGEPAMAAVEAFLGEKITRAELKDVAPDFNREG